MSHRAPFCHARRISLGVFPGSFDPPTVAHLAIAEAAVRQCGLDRLDLSLSHAALGKELGGRTPVEARSAVLRVVAATRPWLGVRVTDARLLVDVAAGYDVLVVGADKWDQLRDPAWYGGEVARDVALAALPRVVVAPRHGYEPSAVEGVGVEVLDVHLAHRGVSSSAALGGRAEWLLPEVVAALAADPSAFAAWAAVLD